jgi:hypothetical protein
MAEYVISWLSFSLFSVLYMCTVCFLFYTCVLFVFCFIHVYMFVVHIQAGRYHENKTCDTFISNSFCRLVRFWCSGNSCSLKELFYCHQMQRAFLICAFHLYPAKRKPSAKTVIGCDFWQISSIFKLQYIGSLCANFLRIRLSFDSLRRPARHDSGRSYQYGSGSMTVLLYGLILS